jgi:hypothetical protein
MSEEWLLREVSYFEELRGGTFEWPSISELYICCHIYQCPQNYENDILLFLSTKLCKIQIWTIDVAMSPLDDSPQWCQYTPEATYVAVLTIVCKSITFYSFSLVWEIYFPTRMQTLQRGDVVHWSLLRCKKSETFEIILRSFNGALWDADIHYVQYGEKRKLPINEWMRKGWAIIIRPLYCDLQRSIGSYQSLLQYTIVVFAVPNENETLQ